VGMMGLAYKTYVGVSPGRGFAALCLLGSAAVHALVAPQHFAEWSGYGWFFLGVTIFQGLYALGLVAPAWHSLRAPWYLSAGIFINLVVIGLYAVTRTVGIPLLGPHPGHVEAVGVADAVSQALELGAVAFLVGLLFSHEQAGKAASEQIKYIGMALVLTVAAIVLLGILSRGLSPPSLTSEISSSLGSPGAVRSSTQTRDFPSKQELLPLLTRRSGSS